MTASAAAAEVRRSRVRFTPRAAILAIIVTAVLFYLVVPLRAYVDQRNRLAQLQHQTQILEQQNDRLQGEVARLKDPAYIEQLARCLGMIKPGEIGFTVVPSGGGAATPDC